LTVVSSSGKTLSITQHYKRTPVVTVKSKQYSMSEVIGTWIGMNVIDNSCFFTDGDSENYHPGNLMWLSKEEGHRWINNKRPPKAKITKEMALFIRRLDIKESGLTRKQLAEMYGVSFETIKEIRKTKTRIWKEMRKPVIKF
jgi:hypothetical protein